MSDLLIDRVAVVVDSVFRLHGVGCERHSVPPDRMGRNRCEERAARRVDLDVPGGPAPSADAAHPVACTPIGAPRDRGSHVAVRSEVRLRQACAVMAAGETRPVEVADDHVSRCRTAEVVGGLADLGQRKCLGRWNAQLPRRQGVSKSHRPHYLLVRSGSHRRHVLGGGYGAPRGAAACRPFVGQRGLPSQEKARDQRPPKNMNRFIESLQSSSTPPRCWRWAHRNRQLTRSHSESARPTPGPDGERWSAPGPERWRG